MERRDPKVGRLEQQLVRPSLCYETLLTRSLENHDQSRIISRLASDSPTDRVTSAKLCCMFHTTLTGTIFIYQGQELGMINIPDGWDISEYKDIEAIQNMESERKMFAYRGPEGEKDLQVSLHSLRMTARDNSRTPMQVSHVTTSIADV